MVAVIETVRGVGQSVAGVFLMLIVTAVLAVVTLTFVLGIGERGGNELERAMNRNAERTADWDHETFDEEYFAADNAGGRSE